MIYSLLSEEVPIISTCTSFFALLSVPHHCPISERVDWLIYLLNGENIGTDDDIRHLTGVAETYHSKVIFLVNKLDSSKKNADSVADTLRKVRGNLTKAGFNDPGSIRCEPMGAI